MAYASAADALLRLLEGKEESALGARCWISEMPDKVGSAANGIEYCSIHVACSNGIEYDLPAFGSEARELFDEALRSILGTPLLVAA